MSSGEIEKFANRVIDRLARRSNRLNLRAKELANGGNYAGALTIELESVAFSAAAAIVKDELRLSPQETLKTEQESEV